MKKISLILALSHGYSYSSGGLKSPQDMLHEAVLNNSAEGIHQAVTLGANCNLGKDGKPSLLWAVLFKKSDCVETLLACGAKTDIGYSGNTILHHALKLNDVETALLLIKNGADFSGYIDLQGNTVMNCAINFALCRSDDLGFEMIQELINRGYDIHSNHWATSIWYAGNIYMNARVLRLFLKNGANPNQIIDTSNLIKGTYGTPLTRAIHSLNHNNVECKLIIKMLLDAGADVNQKANIFEPTSVKTYTPISYAIQLNKGNMAEIIQFLLECGATL